MPDDPLTDRAYVDHVGDGVARLLIGPEGRSQLIEARLLPEGAGAGDWLVLGDEGSLTIIGTDPDLRAQRAHDVDARRQRLRAQRPSGRLRRADP